MARTRAISLVENGTLKAELSELYGYVIENVRKRTLSSALKSQSYTGNPAAGSVEFRRFKNAVANDYGTARAAGKGDAIQAPPTTVNLDTHKEIVEEAAKFDLDTFGVGNIMARRADNHVDTMTAVLERAFFGCAVSEGGVYTPTVTTLEDLLEEYIQKLETVQNDFVDGVERDMINMVCSTRFYGKIRTLLDTKPNPNVDTAAESFGTFHGVKVYSSIYLPATAGGSLMIDEAIAEPVISYPYTDPEKIPQSNDYSVQLFYDFGVKALTPDLIFNLSMEDLEEFLAGADPDGE